VISELAFFAIVTAQVALTPLANALQLVMSLAVSVRMLFPIALHVLLIRARLA